ncbi:hypothetical protein M422DRAFT_266693 [Sphaerobolus stellatus SS14]|uniref:Uncharacterized protein n=1 Tax=Sphaerobolus stellatus (strain SS14) TaxID=990650 RepID=A0A0C9TNG5_SPHS4|nr:hypothetical protein M422DRAFT_266693 [Sphaerobolus stellatus SS14]
MEHSVGFLPSTGGSSHQPCLSDMARHCPRPFYPVDPYPFPKRPFIKHFGFFTGTRSLQVFFDDHDSKGYVTKTCVRALNLKSIEDLDQFNANVSGLLKSILPRTSDRWIKPSYRRLPYLDILVTRPTPRLVYLIFDTIGLYFEVFSRSHEDNYWDAWALL